MSRNGAFLMSREIFDNPIWSDPLKFRLFFFIVGNAVFSDDGVNYEGIQVKRGQFLRSLRNLQDDLTYREGRGNAIKKPPLETLRRKIKELEKEGRITAKSTEYGTLFTVVNYDKYQGFEHYQNSQMRQQWDSNETAVRQRWDNNNNDKNVNNKSQRKYAEDSVYVKLAKYFVEQIRNNNPEFKDPNYQRWANDIRLMMERDNRTEEQIRYLMKWVQQDDFEMANVLSPSKLRKRFDQLVMKVKAERKRMENVIPYRQKQDYQEYQGRYIPDTFVLDYNAGED